MPTSEIFGGDNAESFFDEGLTASMTGDVSAATRHFESAIRLDSSMAAAYHQLGKCYMRLGEIERAVNVLGQVTRKRPKLSAARIDLGNALVHAGNYEQAKNHFQHVLDTEPGNAKALIGLAGSEFAQGRWDAALKYAQAAQGDGGPNFATLFMLGHAAKLTGDGELSGTSLNKADKLIEKYQEMNEDKPEGNFLRGEIAFVGEAYPKALEYYRKAEDRIIPGRLYIAYGEGFGLADVLAKQGLCYQRLENVDRAREIGQRIRKIDPDHALCKALLEGEDKGADD